MNYNFAKKHVSKDAKKIAFFEQALKEKHVFLAFQPIHFVEKTPFPAFYEGLIRFSDVNGDNQTPGLYIEQLEKTVIGRKMDCESLCLCFKMLAEYPLRRLSVNASALSITDQEWLTTLHQQIHTYPTYAERLIIEVTESVAIPDIKYFADIMDALRKYGIAFAIDDFGAGHTSFRYFQELRFDIVKIDRSFVKNIHRSSSQQVILRSLIAVARHFDMMIVGEGVEHIEELECLSELGVDCLQGYYFGYPQKMVADYPEKQKMPA